MTDIQEAARRHGPREYALPGWEPGEEFSCRLSRPGLVAMARAVGFVPNPLIEAIQELFFPAAGGTRLAPEQQAKALYEIARYALVSPTMEELTDAGLELTDEQYLAIYAFALKGADGMARFRRVLGGEPGGDGDGLRRAAVSTGGNP